MIDVIKYIDNYCKNHNIERYSYKDKIISLNNINEILQSSGHVNFIYRVIAYGEINTIADLNKKFLEVATNTDFWDLSPTVEIKDFTTFQAVESNSILTIENTAKFTLYQGTQDAMFQNIKKLAVKYINVIPLTDEDENGNLKVKVKF